MILRVVTADLSPYFCHMLTVALYQWAERDTSSSSTTNSSLSRQVAALRQAPITPLFSVSCWTIFSPWLKWKVSATLLTVSPYSTECDVTSKYSIYCGDFAGVSWKNFIPKNKESNLKCNQSSKKGNLIFIPAKTVL